MRKKKEVKPQENTLRSAIAVGALAILSGAFVGGAILLQLGGDESPRKEESVERMFRGIPQEGTRLGSPQARVVLLEWGDLQCTACADFARENLPQIIEEEVRPGRLALEFRQWPILGEGSTLAAEAALAASLQNRYWQFIEYYYKNQNSQEDPTSSFLREIALASGVNIEQWERDRQPSRWKEVLLENDKQALEYGLAGTPSFLLEKGGSPERLDAQTPEDVLEKIRD